MAYVEVDYTDNMEPIKSWLNGKKTYILGGVAIGTILLYLLGVLDAQFANAVLALCGFGSIITLRAAIGSLEK